MLTLASLAALLAANLLISAAFLLLGSRWVRASHPKYFRALVCVAALWLVGVIALFLSESLPSFLNVERKEFAPLIWVGLCVGQIAFSCRVVKKILGTTTGRAFLACLVALVPSLFILPFTFLVVKPFVVEGFIVPTNSMAPTIVGWHREGVCPHCGNVLFVPASSPTDEFQRPADEFEPMGICGTCQKATRAKSVQPSVQSPDRVMVNKLFGARRWDIVAFRPPRNPELIYLRRLVGLPGEEVFVEDGAVWINGIKHAPPPEIAHLQFSEKVTIPIDVPFGSRDKPLKLKLDEYCVLGDFAMESQDSRFWGALPRANIEGVVSLCYWPASRWHIWR
jgi:signal peptidase I